MAIIEFTVTGQIEVDEDALGIAVANNVRAQPGGAEIDTDAGFRYRLQPAEALSVVLRQGIVHEMETNFSNVGWRPHKLDARVDHIRD